MRSARLLVPRLAQLLPIPTNFRESVALELDGFSEYMAEVTPQQKAAIEELAERIIRSQQTKDPIFEFRVEGHADVARRIPTAERKWFEDNVSRERAHNGFELLAEALEKKGGKDAAKRIVRGSKAFGLGTRSLKVPNAQTEDQFRRNRRVVFIIRQVTFLPPPPPPPERPTSVVEDRFTARLVGVASLTKSFSPATEGIGLRANIEIVDKVEKKKALFDVFAAGAGIAGGPTQVGGSINIRPGPAQPFKTFRLLGNGAPVIDLNSFAGKCTVFVGVGGGAGTATAGGAISISFDALEAAGANTQPGVVPLPTADNTGAQTPGIAAGDVLPLAFMRMRGSVEPL